MPPSLAAQARTALGDSINAHQRFGAMLVAYEAGSCSLGDFKWYFTLVQQMDHIWLKREAVLRTHLISVMSPEPYDPALDVGIEINRQAALRYLREECNVKI